MSAPGGTRTHDTRFRKPVLYPLSYRGGMGRWLWRMAAQRARPYVNGVRRGGDGGIRTPDLCIANAALSQLSYSPTASARVFGQAWPHRPVFQGV